MAEDIGDIVTRSDLPTGQTALFEEELFTGPSVAPTYPSYENPDEVIHLEANHFLHPALSTIEGKTVETNSTASVLFKAPKNPDMHVTVKHGLSGTERVNTKQKKKPKKAKLDDIDAIFGF